MVTAMGSESSLAQITEQCRKAQRAWAQLPVRQRLRPVRILRRLLAEECHRLCEAVARDVGKSFEETLAGELLPLAEACRFLSRQAQRLLRPRVVSRRHLPLWLWPQRDTVYRRPRGVIGIIGTWNYPLLLNGVQIIQALTAGNGVFWKPSELASASARILGDLLARAGYPSDLIHLLPATREAGQELADADVDHIIFTGSSTTGRRLAEHLGRRLVSSTLELSGCDALFVLEDADVDLAARAAWFGATLNRGQTCIASRRILVHDHLYSGFADALKPLVKDAVPMRLALESQVEQADSLVRDALTSGARSLDTPRPNGVSDPFCYPPTIVLDARPEMALCQQASFAPLMAVLPFRTLEEALRIDSRCPYALGASIFTANPAQGAQLASQLRAGLVAINDVIAPTAHPATPFGGRQESGWGVTQGAEGLLEMTVPQVVSVRGGKMRLHYGSTVGKPPLPADGFRGLLEWGHGGTLRQRLQGLYRLAHALWYKA